MSHRRPPWRRPLIVAATSLLTVLSVTSIPATASTAPSTGAAPGAAQAGSTPIYLDPHYSFAERAADLVSRMTLDEKAAQLHSNDAPAIPRLGVQAYTYWNEAQHGINSLGADHDPGTAKGLPHATSFPTNFASSMSWDPKLIYDETTAISDEARGFLDKSLWGTAQNNLGSSASNYGSLTYWAPTVNMDRDPRWGRTDEAFGEDPYFVGQMADAFVDGAQGQTPSGKSLTGYLKIAATAKHYALNNTEDHRSGISSDTDDQTLREYYTAQFRDLIENAHVSGLMTSYNAINGTPSVADTYTVDQLAKRTYGFNGYITSDCGGISTTWRLPPSGHDWAPPGWSTDHKSNPTWTQAGTGKTLSGQAGGQAYALRAGTDLNCTGEEATTQNIRDAIAAGALSEGVLDSALVQLFTVRMETGEFDKAAAVPYTKITKAAIESPAHQELAAKVADNSLVLLQNNAVPGTSKPLLPVAASALHKVVILGDQAGIVNLGNYSGDPTLQVSTVKGISDAVLAANPGATIDYDSAQTSTTATTPAVLSDQTKADIKDADLVLVMIGTDHGVADEGKDRTTLAIPGNYQSMIDQASALGNHRMALVIQTGGPVAIGADQAKFPAIVFSGFNGESQGTALADVLTGKQNPSGHLNFTWYKDDSQLPAMSNYYITAAGTDGIGRTYQYFTGTPTYPFGYGLSYSTFAYTHVHADTRHVSADGKVRVSFDVKNTGRVAGATVAQLYAATQFSVPGTELPKKRLAGFKKTTVLRPGQSEHITLSVTVADLALWNADTMRQFVPDGTYAFQVGADSSQVLGTAKVKVTGAITPKVKYVTVQPDAVQYQVGDSFDLTGKNPWIKDDTDPAQEHRNLGVTADNVVEAVNNDQSFADLAHARVNYTSSDPNVATVDGAGHVKIVGSGVTTLTAKVNGVSGSAVITAKYPFALTAPATVQPGAAFPATGTFTNTGGSALTGVSTALTLPAGWTAQPAGPSPAGTVAAGASVTTTWKVTPPAGAARNGYDLQATVDYTGPGGPGESTAAVGVGIPNSSLSAAFDNIGITDDAQPKAGSLDGGAFSLSAQALAAAGVTPGATITHGGFTFTWPNVPAGKADNVVADGQAFDLPGSGHELAFLGTATSGSPSGSGVITYTDGTTQPFSIAFPDWWGNGGDVVATTPYINTTSGHQQKQTVHVYMATVAIDPTRKVQFITLPTLSLTIGGKLHLFAAAIGG